MDPKISQIERQGQNGNRFARRVALAASALVLAAGLSSTTALAATELNVLSWCDLSDPNVLKPFEEKFDVRVNAKDYDATSTAVTLLKTSDPGDWDVINLDGPAIPGIVAANPGLFEALNPDDYPWDDIYPQMHRPDDHYVDGALYGVPSKLNWNAITYNGANVDPNDLTSYEFLWSGEYAGRIAVWDFYSQNIQILSQHYGLTPEGTDEESLKPIRENLLKMKRDGAIVGDIVGVQTALAAGEVDIVFGAGEWAAGPLHLENPDMNWTVPNEGGVYVILASAILASSTKKDLAVEFVKYLTSPEGQARLSTSACTWGIPVNQRATEALSDEQRTFLQIDSQEDFIARSQSTYYYDEALDKAMLDIWTEFLQE